MEAILLAAGLGTRLRPHTLHTPKPLLPVRGRPILDWTLGALPPIIDRVIVVVHYLADQVEKYLSRQQHFSSWATVFQDQPRGTGDALRQCQPHLRSDRFLVLNGDDLFGAADLVKLAQCPAGILVHPVTEPRRFGIVQVRPDGTLEKLLEKPDLEGNRLANTGAYLFPKEVFNIQIKLSSRNEYEITDYVSSLALRQPFHVVQAQFWLPIGDEEAWKKAEDMQLETFLNKEIS